jgi:L-threonylcarbamoyladenylate synthase
MALILTDKRGDIEKAALKIREGDVVIFPTETVYGMGANAMDEKAIDKIFAYKNRPQNNPLILHINNKEMAEALINITSMEKDIVDILATTFWPGPITFLVKKSKYVNNKCTAGSKYVGLRCPQNKLARDLISLSGVPIAAPSANISGKVSSTTFDHVFGYFKDNKDITIIKTEEPCLLGIESTIIKIDNNTVSIVRPGIIVEQEIKDALLNLDIEVKVDIPLTQSVNPGSHINHYQIDKKVVLANFMSDESLNDDLSKFNIMKAINYYLMTSIFIDFGGHNLKMMDKFYGYVDLSEKGDPKEALFNLYNVLHQLNDIDCSNIIVFNFYKNKKGYYRALYDRLIRCCGGKEIIIPYIVEEDSLSEM